MASREAIAVIRSDGSIQTEGAEEPFPLYSITKTIIASLLIGEEVDVTRTASDWFSPTFFPHAEHVTIEHLLTHTSGLRDYGALPEYQRSVAKGGPAWDDETFAEATLRRPLLFSPNTAFAYANPGYWVLKRILELETDQTFAELIQSRVATPLEIPSFSVADGLFSDTLPTYEAGWVWHGLVLGTACDTAKFMSSGFTTHLADLRVPVPDAGPQYPRAAYGYGVMTNLDGSVYGHNGGGPGFSTACFRTPENDTTIAVLMAHDGPDDQAYARLTEIAQVHQLPAMTL